MKKDPDKIASIEKAIAKKYGPESVQNPKSNWNEEKEKEYLEQIKKFEEKHLKAAATSDKVEVNGVFVSKKLLNRESINWDRTCSVCDKHTIEKRDDIYFLKFDCCLMCYIKYVEDREERWSTGWRPDLGENKEDGNNT
jgi:hypothetical protein